MSSPNPTPGWYYAQGDPPGTQRYWDGSQWVGSAQPIAQGQAVASAPMAPTGSYPISLSIAPAAPQSRLTVFFRYFTAIPHAIVLGLIGYAVAVVWVIAWFAILFTGKFPKGMYNFVAGYQRWTNNLTAYQYLLTGKWPPFSMDDDPGYPVRTFVTPQTEGRSRLSTFFRPIMIIPHIIVLYIIGIAAVFVLVIAWFAALFTGRVPDGMHNFLAGVARWGARVSAYALLLTDEYPPFSMAE